MFSFLQAGDGQSLEEFERALADLHAPVARACSDNDEWPAKVAAAVYAVLDFAVAHPTAARTLTIEPTARGVEGGSPYPEMIEGFAKQLDLVAPRERRLPGATDVALVGGIARIVGGYLRSARMDRLVDLGPELVQFALLPYLGFAEAKRWSERPGSIASPDRA